MDKITLEEPQGATAEVYLHGAHITSWKPAGGQEIIFVSKQAVFKPPKAIRGGIPLCFPQFGKLGPLPQHGFARNTAFKVVKQSSNSVTLALQPTAEELSLAGFSHEFKLSVTVTLHGDELVQELEAENVGDAAFDLTAALHTYFSVSSIDKVKVHGLQGLTYKDNTNNMLEDKEDRKLVVFPGELDRIYVKTPDVIEVVDEGRGHVIIVQKTGLPDAVVWNPWADKARAMSDFGDEEYKVMVCVEPALAASGPFSLRPQQCWSAKQVLRVQPL